MKKSKYLITGSSSGLGKYLNDQLKGTTFKRNAENVEATNILIHCAFNRTKEITSKNLYQYLLDNVFLTKKLVKIPHKKFIYISSVDIYPKNNKRHSEDETIDVNQISGSYAMTKLMSESLIQNLCPNFLILRCPSLLGRDAKENSLIKIINEEYPTLTLSSKSVFNFILHKDILEFIKIAAEKDLQGIYNLVSSENIILSQIAKLFGKKVNFGTYLYNVGNIDNKKAAKLFSSLNKTSEDTINKFMNLR
ncbi:NAD-dependent epimerase/dehydratase family protein [Candidatus Roizmanbacteria bacterium]|nr:NAD-dependent epimerase/dehydratase family protein [Candidatus Roizmanbacteria bacterium]